VKDPFEDRTEARLTSTASKADETSSVSATKPQQAIGLIPAKALNRKHNNQTTVIPNPARASNLSGADADETEQAAKTATTSGTATIKSIK